MRDRRLLERRADFGNRNTPEVLAYSELSADSTANGRDFHGPARRGPAQGITWKCFERSVAITVDRPPIESHTGTLQYLHYQAAHPCWP